MYHLIAEQRLLQINPFGNTNTTTNRKKLWNYSNKGKAGIGPFDIMSPFNDP